MDGHFVFSVLDYYSVPSQFLYMTFTALGPTFLLSKHLGRELLYRPVYVIPVGQIFKVIVSTYILTNSVWVLPLFHILTNTFHFRQPWGMYISLWSFLMTDKIEQLFINLLAISVSSFVKYPFKAPAIFLLDCYSLLSDL